MSDFEKEVNELASQISTGDDGKWVLPEKFEDLPEPTQFAVRAERRRRDTQSSLTQAQSQNKVLDAQNKAIQSKLEKELGGAVSQEQKQELDDLLQSDPEAWRKRMNEIEASNRTNSSKEAEKIASEAGEEALIAHREEVLEQFIEQNPGFELTDDIFNDYLPSGLKNRLADGRVSFEDFLHEARDFLGKKKVVGDISQVKTEEGGVDISQLSGGSTPGTDAADREAQTSYKDEVY